MTYSQLINRREETTKRSTRDGRTVERIVVHHWAGIYGGVERLVYSSDQASANYIILNDGTLIGSVPEEYAAWTSGSWEVDSRSVTVEVQNETTAPEWRVSQAAINTLIQLIIDLGVDTTGVQLTVREFEAIKNSTQRLAPDRISIPSLARLHTRLMFNSRADLSLLRSRRSPIAPSSVLIVIM